METVYTICAIVGGALIVCQFLLTLLGLGGHHDVGGHDVGGHDFTGHDAAGHDTATDHSHDGSQHGQSNRLLGVLTFRTVVAGLAFFGLAGLAASEADLGPAPAAALAVAAGLAALFLVAWLMRTLGRMNVDGTARIERAVGATGTVYLSIPGARAGAGKVHVSVQHRTMEYKAVTARDQLPTGAKVVVVSVVAADTVEVSPVSNLERAEHA
jgi:hypothetical protein